MLCAHLRPLAPSSSDFFALLPSPLPIPQGKRAMNSPEMKEARENQRKLALLSTRSIGGGGGSDYSATPPFASGIYSPEARPDNL